MTARKSQKNIQQGTTVDAAEVAQFESLGEKWWDENGPMRPLHRLNPVRLGYIRDSACAHFKKDAKTLRPLAGLTAADIGCGGGLVAEPLCRMGAAVTGVDAGPENIRVATAHAKKQRLDIDYRAATVETVARSGKRFDIVTALEIVEHVSDVPLFMEACCKIVKPGGLLVMSTLNRTPKSYLLGIVAAERILRWLPVGTHDWKKFMKPSELARPIEQNGLRVTDVRGLIYNPLTRDFALSKTDLDVNYLLTAIHA
jgi:2-polyprenyl-6-hydroxyphenyl methylase/3-demethylubiquinone-9 3-methyltransferase